MADIAHLVLKEHEYDPNGDTILVLQEWHEAVPDTDTMETGTCEHLLYPVM